MSAQRKSRADGAKSGGGASRSWIWLVAAFAAVALIVVFQSGKGPTSTPPGSGQSAPAPAPSSAVPVIGADTNVAAAPAFKPLLGRWMRPDGGYVIEVRRIESDGTAEAGYYNPRPIRVAKAAAFRDGAALKLFVELRDVNYPGSTYVLEFDPKADVLRGEYFQATYQERFAVQFERLKE